MRDQKKHSTSCLDYFQGKNIKVFPKLCGFYTLIFFAQAFPAKQNNVLFRKDIVLFRESLRLSVSSYAIDEKLV